MESLNQDLRTDQEKRQDAFDDFIKEDNVGKKARIIFDGNRFTVRFFKITDDTFSLKIIRGKKHFFDGDTITLSRHFEQDVELVR